MSGCCSDDGRHAAVGSGVRRVLWWALALNATMFAVELGAGLAARSVALQADALDFLGDSANYGLSLAVLAMGPLWRSRAALVKGATLGAFGLWVLATTVDHALHQGVPHGETMGAVGLLALVVNVVVAWLLFRHRGGDANLRSAWLCSRNDAIGNLAVIAASAGVLGTGTAWPDLAVGAIIAALALSAAIAILRQATAELVAAGTGTVPRF